MALDTWLIYLLASIGLSLTPGPNSLLALTHGALYGARRTLFTIVGGVFGFERFDFGAGEERKLAEVFADLGILGVYEELVELVGARFFRIEPDGATLGFAELCAVGFGDERKGESPGGESRFFADEIGAGRDLPPVDQHRHVQLPLNPLLLRLLLHPSWLQSESKPHQHPLLKLPEVLRGLHHRS